MTQGVRVSYWAFSGMACVIFLVSLLFPAPGFSQTGPSPLPVVTGAVAGSIEGTFEVNDLGAATYSIPISVPPGTADVFPKLSLNYSSQIGTSFLGHGWSLGGLSTISRCQPVYSEEHYAYAVDFDSFDRFCLDGQRMVDVSGSHPSAGTEYRTRSASFSKIIAHGHSGTRPDSGPEGFIVQTKSGLRYEYGMRPDARVEVAGGAGVLSWLLSKVTDRLGNYYAVYYQRDLSTGEVLPEHIDYTGNDAVSQLPFASVRFEYEPLPTPLTSYTAGKAYKKTKILKRIKTFAEQIGRWEYRLTYDTNSMRNEQFLISVEECDSSNVCLPPTNFIWGDDIAQNNSFQQGASFNDLAPAQGYVDQRRNPVIIGDWNGDGRTDIARMNGSTATFYVSTTSGYQLYGTVSTTGLTVLGNQSDGEALPIVAGDWDGDGLTDFMRANLKATGLATPVYHFYRSTGTGFALYQTVTVGEGGHCPLGTNNEYGQILTGDWNGDGRTDWARVTSSCNQFYRWVWDQEFRRNSISEPIWGSSVQCPLTQCPYIVGDWNGDRQMDVARVYQDRIAFFYHTQSIHQPFIHFYHVATVPNFTVAQGYSSVDVYPIVIGDWNGDGATDFGRLGSGEITLCKSNALAFYAGVQNSILDGCVTTPFPSAPGYPNHTNYPVLTGDWNGDGTTDLARTHPDGVQLFRVFEGTPTYNLFLPQLSNTQGYLSNLNHPMLVGDWNGDGFFDIARFGQNGLQAWNHAYSDTALVREIANGFGGMTRVEYGLLTDAAVYQRGPAQTYPKIIVQGGMPVVKRVEVTDDSTTSGFLNYRYRGLRYDVLSREAMSFTELASTNEITGNVKTAYAVSGNSAYAGAPWKTETRLANGTLIHSTENTWASLYPSTSETFAYKSRAIERFFELNGALIRSQQTDYTYDNFGNVTQSVLTRSDGSGETTVNVYNNHLPSWTLGQLTQSTITRTVPTGQTAPAMSRRASFTYQTGSGLLVSETVEPSSGSPRTTTYSYDAFGNIVSTSRSAPGVVPRVLTQAFDSYGRYPIRRVNALGHVESLVHHPAHGKLTSITDINGQVTSFVYDGFGRETLVIHPDQTEVRTLYHQAPSGSPQSATHIVRVDSSGMGPRITYYDGLSREVRREVVGFQGQTIYNDTLYDDTGHVWQSSEPYIAGTTPLWTESYYDALGRLTFLREPGNRVTTHSYSSNHTTSTTNALGQTHHKRFCDQGRLILSTDSNGKQLEYRYDAFGNLIWTRDSVGNITQITYDVFGHKLQLDEPNTGVTNYQYNGFGELVAETNAKGETRQYLYDPLGRKVQITSPEGVETYTYDLSRYGIGQLHRVDGLNGYREIYSYDNYGRQISVTKVINGKKYATSVTYDGNGRVRDYYYPSSFGLRRIFNTHGYLSEVRRLDNQALIWQGVSRDARGNLERERYGNGLETTSIHRAEDGLLVGIQTGSSQVPTSVQDLRFHFDNIGNLTSRIDNRRALTENFSYDSLNRLTSSHVMGLAPLTVTYDELGNITSRSDVGTYHYQSLKPHAVTQIVGPRGNSYSYDLVGNRITSTGGSVLYNSSSKPVSITQGPNRLEFRLDPDGARVEELNFRNSVLDSRKVYIGRDFQVTYTGTVAKEEHFIEVDGEAVSILTITRDSLLMKNDAGAPSWMHYLHKDHLGSIHTITNEKGSIVEDLSFNAWGERRDPETWDADPLLSSSIDRGFTGHEQLDEVGLIHMNGRVYDPVSARFISADPFIQTVSNQQAFNRYSYVQNNPLSFVDPSGYFLKGFLKKAAKFVKQALPMIVAVAITYYVAPYLTSYVAGKLSAIPVCTVKTAGIVEGISAGIGAAGAGIASSVASTVVAGGSPIQGLRAGLKAAPYSMLNGFSANQIGTLGLGKDLIAKSVAHAASNGAVNVMRGNDFRSGFVTGFFSSLSEGSGFEVTVLAGGTSAALSGGKFADGAMQAAFIHLYNAEGTHNGMKQGRGSQQRNDVNFYTGDIGGTFLDDVLAFPGNVSLFVQQNCHNTAVLSGYGNFSASGMQIAGETAIAKPFIRLAVLGDSIKFINCGGSLKTYLQNQILNFVPGRVGGAIGMGTGAQGMYEGFYDESGNRRR